MYNTTVWAEATLDFKQWKEVFKSDKAVKSFVYSDYYFVSSIWSKNNVRYSGIHRLNDREEIIPKTGLNLDNYEWVNVMKKVEEFNIASYGPQGKKGEKRHVSPNVVQMWSYVYFLNGEEVKTEEPALSYYSESQARNAAELNEPDLKLKDTDNLEMKFVSEYTTHPSEFLQMKMALHQIVRGGVSLIRAMKCPACQLTPLSPSQKDHMVSTGCMDDDGYNPEQYIDVVLSVIKPEDFVTLYNTVCRSLEISPGQSSILAEGILAWLGRKYIMETVELEYELSWDEERKCTSNSVLSHENSPLLDVVREVYHDMNFSANFLKKLCKLGMKPISCGICKFIYGDGPNPIYQQVVFCKQDK